MHRVVYAKKVMKIDTGRDEPQSPSAPIAHMYIHKYLGTVPYIRTLVTGLAGDAAQRQAFTGCVQEGVELQTALGNIGTARDVDLLQNSYLNKYFS